MNRPELAPAVWAVPFVTTLVVFPATVFADRAGWLRTGRRVEGTTFSTSSAIGAAIAVTLSDLPGVAHEWAMVVAAANAAALTGLFLGLAVTSPFTARKRP